MGSGIWVLTGQEIQDERSNNFTRDKTDLSSTTQNSVLTTTKIGIQAQYREGTQVRRDNGKKPPVALRILSIEGQEKGRSAEKQPRFLDWVMTTSTFCSGHGSWVGANSTKTVRGKPKGRIRDKGGKQQVI